MDITASGIPSSSSGLPFIPQNQSETATGTGFEIDSHGDIVTAEHVVADAPKIYNGHPLYLYSGDQNPGDTSGEGINAFGGLCYAVSPAGNQIVGQASTSNSSGGCDFSY